MLNIHLNIFEFTFVQQQKKFPVSAGVETVTYLIPVQRSYKSWALKLKSNVMGKLRWTSHKTDMQSRDFDDACRTLEKRQSFGLKKVFSICM